MSTDFAALDAATGGRYQWLTEDRQVDTVYDLVRPRRWSDLVGQAKLKRRLQVSIDAAMADGRPLRHVFLDGPKGAGKTTVALLVGQEIGGPVVEIGRPCRELEIARALFDGGIDQQHGVLFVDEAHRWGGQVEALLTLLEQGFVDTKYDRYHFPNLTVIAATTERRLVKPTVRDRFPVYIRFEDYSLDEMTEIVCGMAARLNVTLHGGVAPRLAAAASGVPRVARTLVEAARDLGPVTADEILEFCDIEPDGLTGDHVRYLQAVAAAGGQCGLDVLQVRLGLDKQTVTELERMLYDRQYIGMASGVGRYLTAAGRRRVS
jgi:Holliday junction DNA helicase RuvB